MNFQLFHGDCLTVMKDISSASVDLVICDLPYGCLSSQAISVDRSYRGEGIVENTKLACPWDVKIDLEAFWKEIKRIRRNEHSPVLHFTTTKFGFDLYKSNPEEFRYDLVWDKQRGISFLQANKMPMRSHEMVYVFSKAGAYYNRVDISGNYKAVGEGCKHGPTNKGKRCALSIIPIMKITSKHGHPTEKPVDIYKFLIERYCPPGGTVLDPTFGSGNSGLASLQLGRKYIGIEKDKPFFDKFNGQFQNTIE